MLRAVVTLLQPFALEQWHAHSSFDMKADCNFTYAPGDAVAAVTARLRANKPYAYHGSALVEYTVGLP